MTEQEWEAQMRDRGHAKLIEQTLKIERAGQESETIWGNKLRREKIEALAHEIKRERARGGKSTLARFLRDTPLSDRQIAARVITVSLQHTQGKPVTFAKGFDTLGEELEKDTRWRLKQDGKPQPVPWTEEDRAHIAGELFGIMRRAGVGIVDWAKFRDQEDAHSTHYIVADETTQAYRKDTLESTQCPQWMPMIEPPQPWDAHGLRGGYLDEDHEDNFTLVLGNEHAAAIPSPQVIEAVNIVQATAWRINTRVLGVMQQMWKEKRAVGKLPANIKPEPYRLITKLKAAATPEEKRKEQQSAVYKGYRKHYLSPEGKRRAAEATLTVATECRAFERIYFPHRIDFTGRMYPVPLHLNPQGPDYAKALIVFAEGEPIKLHGAGALAVHGANLYGIKGSFEQRHLWFGNHEEEILEAAARPLKRRWWWTKAAKPWQFLAFCFEWERFYTWAEASKGPLDAESQLFISYLPVAMDGTCNGLQHYAAMMRDAKSGAATNLTAPATEPISEEEQAVAEEAGVGPMFDGRGDVLVAPPQDLYKQVADEVVEEIQKSRKLLVDGTEIDEDAAEKLRALADSGQITRTMMKSHVMTLPYGKTPHSRRLTLEEYLTDPEESEEALWEDIPSDALTYLNNCITEAIKKHVPAANAAMEWLRKIAKLFSKAQRGAAAHPLPVTWETPSGFKIAQHYRDIRTRQVEMRPRNSITGKAYKLTLAKHRVDDEMDTRSQLSAFAPNFVHSMDASHLVATVLLAKSAGITSFAMVHDSYATTATQTKALTAALTTAFRTMYTEHDVLAELRDQVVKALGNGVEVPPLPEERGDLKLGEMPFLFN